MYAKFNTATIDETSSSEKNSNEKNKYKKL